MKCVSQIPRFTYILSLSFVYYFSMEMCDQWRFKKGNARTFIAVLKSCDNGPVMLQSEKKTRTNEL